ncbi:MAG: DUF99 family protein [Candidatus Nanoarchaeia archaeon]
MFKPQARILGVDDSPHLKGKTKKVLVVGVLFRGGEYLDYLTSTFVKLDGLDATKKLIKMISRCRAKESLQAIMLDGIALGGFNVIDIQEVYKKTKLPVLIITRKKPNFSAIRKALNHFKDGRKRWLIIQKAGSVKEFVIKNKNLVKPIKIYYQCSGLTDREVQNLLKISITHSAIPEPIRVAHIIGQGIVLGESRGRA